MAEGYPNPIVLDATVLTNFASADSIDFLVEAFESPVVVSAVRDEINRGNRLGYDYLETIADSFGDQLPIIDVDRSAESSEIRDRLDAGEAESLLAVIERDGTLATDDLAARRVADERTIPVVGSVGLLVLGVEQGRIDEATADGWLETWRNERGYYAPVESVSDVLDDDQR
ncbi:hypothetical protein [Haloterrigena alkaliphila]|uniref:Nucleic acid-binding protein, contains PIN domain n=1 Tax=Haloterrigena alkaliphila TaxID=2816475 RepID=A0A8A2VEB1_9EURY|nr:hypothetical protein [Haloterrigena alkaliphila]QSW99017.1 hypothetical protein J0X25_16785 [Haloterrigena alkaliphila]